jgi:N-acetylmuramate 1-kinase
MTSTDNAMDPSNAPGTHSDPGLNAVRGAFETFGEPFEGAQELAGGASTRRFFRVPYQASTAIAMYIPLPSQEIVKARQARGSEPFVEVAQLLHARGVRVPQILKRSEAHHVLLVEDLGDDTLANYLLRSDEARVQLYQTAVQRLARAQGRLDDLPEGCVIRTRAFDEQLLRWEVDHFRDYALNARGIVLSNKDDAIFTRAADYVAKTIASWPRGFVHRDYQSRNLMVVHESGKMDLAWIDFQDAMMGPRAYDLVALLTDSYQTFDREFIEARLDEFCAERGIVSERAQLGFEFDFITVQRKLKDAGRFIFIHRENGNDGFLGFVEPTIEKARAALSRVKDHGPLAELDDLLARVLPV